MSGQVKQDRVVVTAVGLVTTNKESLMLSKYGLNALSELCVPSKQNYLENAYHALMHDGGSLMGALESLSKKLKTPNHDDQAVCIATILEAISQAVESSDDNGAIALFGKCAQTIGFLARTGIQNKAFIETFINLTQRATSFGVVSNENVPDIVSALWGAASSGKLSREQEEKCYSAMCSIAAKSEGTVRNLCAQGFHMKIAQKVQVCAEKGDTSSVVESYLRFLHSVNTEYPDSSALDKRTIQKMVIPAAELEGSKASLIAQDVLKGLYTESDFNNALNTLMSPESNRSDIMDSYFVLFALANEKQFVQKIVDSGFIPTIVDSYGKMIALFNGSDDEVEAMASIQSLIKTIANSSLETMELLISYNVFTPINQLFGLIEHVSSPVLIKSLMTLAASLANCENGAISVGNTDIIPFVLNYIDSNCTVSTFEPAAIDFIRVCSRADTLLHVLHNASAFEIVCYAINKQLGNRRHVAACIETLDGLKGTVEDLIYTTARSSGITSNEGSLAGVGTAGFEYSTDSGLATTFVDIISGLTGVANRALLDCAPIVAALCLIAIIHPLLKDICVETLGIICSSDTAVGLLNVRNLRDWRSNPDKVLALFAECSVLPQLNGVDNQIFGPVVDALINCGLDIITGEILSAFKSQDFTKHLCARGESVNQVLTKLQFMAIANILSISDSALANAYTGKFCGIATDSRTVKLFKNSQNGVDVIEEAIGAMITAVSAGKFDSPEVANAILETYKQMCGVYGSSRQLLWRTSELYTAAVNRSDRLVAPLAYATSCFDNVVAQLAMNKYKPLHLLESLRNVRYSITCGTEKSKYVADFKRLSALEIILEALNVSGDHHLVREEAPYVIRLLMDDSTAADKANSIMTRLRKCLRAPDPCAGGVLVETLNEARGFSSSTGVAKLLDEDGFLQCANQLISAKDTLSNPTDVFQLLIPTMANITNTASAAGNYRKGGHFGSLVEGLLGEPNSICGSGNVATLTSAFVLLKNVLGNPADCEVISSHGLIEFITTSMCENASSPLLVHAGKELLDAIAELSSNSIEYDIYITEEIRECARRMKETIKASNNRCEKAACLEALAGILAGGDQDTINFIVSDDEFLTVIWDCIETVDTEPGEKALAVLAAVGDKSGLAERWKEIVRSPSLDRTVHALENFAGKMEATSENVANLVNAFSNMADRNVDTDSINRFARSSVINKLISQFEGDGRVTNSLGNLRKKSPPCTEEFANLLVQATEQAQRGDTTGLNKTLCELSELVRTVASIPDEYLAPFPQFCAATAAYIDSSAYEEVCALLTVRVTTGIRTLKHGSPHVYESIINTPMLNALFSVESKKCRLWTRPTSVAYAADCIRHLALSPYRPQTIAAHMNNLVACSLVDHYKNDARTQRAVILMIKALFEEWPDTQAMIDKNPDLVSKMIESLTSAGRGKMNASDIADIMSVLTPIMANGVDISEGDWMKLNDLLAELEGISTSICDTTTSQAVIMYAGTLARSPYAKINAEAMRCLANIAQSLDSNQLAAPDTCSTIFDVAGDLEDGEETYEYVYSVESTVLKSAAENEVPPSSFASGLINSISSNNDDVHNASINAVSNNYLADAIVRPYVDDSDAIINGLPAWSTSPEDVTAYLSVLNEALDDPTLLQTVIQNDTPFLSSLAQLIYPFQTGDFEYQGFSPIMDSVAAKIAEVVNDDGDTVKTFLKDGECTQILNTPALIGAPVDQDLSVKKVYKFLSQKLAQREPVSPNETDDSIIHEYFEYVAECMLKYCQEPVLTKEMFFGDEIKWGGLCYKLWLEYDYYLCPTVIDWDVAQAAFYNELLLWQSPSGSGGKDATVGTSASVALAAVGLEFTPGGFFLREQEGWESVCAQNIRICLDDPEIMHTVAHILPRLKLVECSATDRTVFPTTEVPDVLYRAWDNFDAGVYDITVLQQIIRDFRKIISPSHAEWVQTNALPQRVVHVLETQTDPATVIDALFLVGILSNDYTIKTIVGKLGAVSLILGIVRDNLCDGGSSKIVINGLSALAVLVLSHNPNDDEFVSFNGLNTVTYILQHRYKKFGELSAVSALIANSSFKRDDVKAMYGSSKVACLTGLSRAINEYNSDGTEASFRAISALFKAVANLALYAPNIRLIIDSGAAATFLRILEMDGLPDFVLSDTILPITNLTTEFFPNVLAEFNILIEKLLDIVSDPVREQGDVVINGVNALRYIIRLDLNAIKFAELEGVEKMTQTFHNWSPYCVEVVPACLNALCECAAHASIAQILIKNDYILLLNSVLNNEYFGEDTPPHILLESVQLCFRGLRYLIRSNPDRDVFVQFCSYSGLTNWLWYLENMNEDYVLLIEELLNFGAGITRCVGPPLDGIQTSLLVQEYGVEDAKHRALMPVSNLPNMLCSEYNVVTNLAMDIYILGNCLSNLAAILTDVSMRQRPDQVCSILYMLNTLLCYGSELDGAVDSFTTGDQTYALKTLDKSFSDAIEQLLEPDETIYCMILQIVHNMLYLYGVTLVGPFLGKGAEYHKSFVRCSTNMPRSLKKLVKFHLDLIGEACSKRSTDMIQAYLSFNLDAEKYTSWHEDVFMNGVQDLKFKDEIRTGGRCEMIISGDAKTKTPIYWKSSGNLMVIQWIRQSDVSRNAAKVDGAFGMARVARKLNIFGKGAGVDLASITHAEVNLNFIEFPNSIRFTKYKLYPGCMTDAFTEYGVGGLSGVNKDKCISLISKSEDVREYSLIFNSMKERDTMMYIINQWRLAANHSH